MPVTYAVEIGSTKLATTLDAALHYLRRHDPSLAHPALPIYMPTQVENGTEQSLVFKTVAFLRTSSGASIRLRANLAPYLHICVTRNSDAQHVLKQVHALIKEIHFSVSRCHRQKRMHVTYAIRLDYYPMLPFAEQLDDTESKLGKIQKFLGASERYVAWTVPCSEASLQRPFNEWFMATHGITSGVNFGLNALTVARMMCMQHIQLELPSSIDVYRIVGGKSLPLSISSKKCSAPPSPGHAVVLV